MQSKGVRGAVLGAVAAAAMLLAGTAQAALQDRDLNGDTVVDAFYDTDLDITWLRNANVNGLKGWSQAIDWADNFSFGGYSDWRLPTSDLCLGFNCTGSEMGHLWYTELGNPSGGPMTNTGNFQNLQSFLYWSGQGYAPAGPDFAMFFDTRSGVQWYNGPSAFYALAVRPGDVVPEPETYALMLTGLAALALARRNQRR